MPYKFVIQNVITKTKLVKIALDLLNLPKHTHF